MFPENEAFSSPEILSCSMLWKMQAGKKNRFISVKKTHARYLNYLIIFLMLPKIERGK
jgi:hypothetical protein